MKGILAVARRELDGYFATPLGWIVLCAFLLVTGFFFAFSLYEFNQYAVEAAFNPYAADQVSVDELLIPMIFGNWAVILLLVAPAITMRLFSEDVRQRSFELLLSSPLSSGQVVLGKYLGVLGFLAVLFALTLYQVAALYWVGSPDPGVLAANYGAMFLFAAACAAVGLLASSLSDNQLVAFIISFAVLLVLFVLGWFQGEEGFMGALGSVSVLAHMNELLKGLVHLEDLVYYVTFVALLLFVTQQRVESFRWAGGMGGSSRTMADTAIDVAAGLGLLAVISKVVRVVVSGREGLLEGAGNVTWLVLVGVGLMAMGAWAWRNREQLQQGMEARGTRLMFGSLALVSLALGVTVALNMLAHRYDQRWDVTASQRFALSDQTLKVLRGLDQDVELLAFFNRGSVEEDQFRTLVQGYADESERLRVRFIDPQVDPLLAREHEIQSSFGTVVLRLPGDAAAGEAARTQRLSSDFDEEALTNALIRLTSGVEHTLCFTRGHEELDPDDDYSPVGLGAVVLKIEDLNYTVQHVSLAREGRVPEGCAVLVAAGPQVDFLPQEREVMAAWVAGGGDLLVMLDPTHAPQLAADMARYGIRVGDDIVLEVNPNYQLVGGDPSYILLDEQSLAPHPITEPIKGAVLLRVARSVAAMEGAAGVEVQELARTTPYGWGETRYTDPAAIQADPGQDLMGPVPLIAVAEVTDPAAISVGRTTLGAEQPAFAPAAEDAPEDATEAAPEVPAPAEVAREAGARVVVIGDTDFASNELLDQVSNQDLLMNALAWLVGEEDQVSIRPNDAARGSLTMSGLQYLVVALTSLLFVPGLALVAGIGTWRRRRSL